MKPTRWLAGINLAIHYEDAAVPEVIAIVIPVVSIVFGVSIGMLALYLDYRRRNNILKLYHAERMAAIEKGIELPPLPPEFFKSRATLEPPATRHRRSGLILLFLGIAIGGAMFGMGIPAFWWGMVPAAIGLALLISGLLEAREQRKPPQP